MGGGRVTMKTTVRVEVNMYSPQMGQSHSVERSMQRWESLSWMDMQTPQVSNKCQHKFSDSVSEGAHLAVEEILPQSLPYPTDPAVVAVVYTLLRIIIPQFTLRPISRQTTRRAFFASPTLSQ